MTNNNLAQAVGRRKTSIARVYLRKGTGNIRVNSLSAEDYFQLAGQRQALELPLAVTNRQDDFDIYINVIGGGKSGQSQACLHGIARALVRFDENHRAVLRKNSCLTRDSRMVERKKYGQRGARRSFQFSKR